MTWRRSLLLVLLAAVPLVSGCAGATESDDSVAEPPTATSPSESPNPSPPASTKYCDSVRQAMAVRPPSGSVDRPAFARYAEAVEAVVANAPADIGPFWEATAQVSRSVAKGGQGDPAASQKVLAGMAAAADSIKRDCQIDINPKR